MLSILRQGTHRLLSCLSTAIPTSCALCHARAQENLCTDCHHQYFAQRAVRCYQCANPLTEQHRMALLHCGSCQKHPPAFDATIAAVDYAPPVDQLIQSFKFNANLSLAPLFSRLLFDAINHQNPKDFPLPTLLGVVPLGLERLSKRGFNQALEIAKPLSDLLRVPLDPQLAIRTRETDMQSTIAHNKRLQNIRNAFMIPPASLERIQGQHIGIIDDVLTTGSTLNELAATLKRHGATRVTGIVFARTPP